MRVRGITRVLVVAVAFVALVPAFRSDPAAQYTPTLSAVATGNVVVIDWTPIAGAQGYTLVAGTLPGSQNIAVVNIPANLGTHAQVSAPTGTYYLRVRAFLGSLSGPFSNEAVVSPGVQPCEPGSTPTLAVSVANNVTTASWTPVPGAVNYIVQWSRSPGAPELAEAVTGTSTSRAIPMNGTFYVRVVAVTNGCANTTSNEEPFTIAVVRRHLSASEILSHLKAIAAEFPRAWQHSAREGDPERLDFMILAWRRLYTVSGGTVGGNFRRAVVGDISADGISVENPADGRYYYADVISCSGWVAGAPCSPLITYTPPFHSGALLRNESGNYAPWGFANPFGVPGSYGPFRTYLNYGPAGGW